MKIPAGISTLARPETLHRIASESFDVLVIGGGITGAGIALDAASRKLKVLLVEKQDFGAGTSSRSTKLIHGGLRYLKNLEFKLVATVARERKILHQNAPHLVTPEKMLLPVYENAAYGYFATKAGLTLYEFLGQVKGPERHRMLSAAQTRQQEPLLDQTCLIGSGLFTEYRTDDARLTLEVLKTAQNNGATCLNYVAFSQFLYVTQGNISGAKLTDMLSGLELEIKTRCVINAAGPWCAALMGKDQPVTQPVLFHTKGVHLVFPYKKLPLKQSVYFDIPGGRMLFAIPRQEITYVGTTDTPYTGNLENPAVAKDDALYLLTQLNLKFPQANLTLTDVVSSWAGIRPLLYQKGKDPVNISRKDEIFVSRSGLITVGGGKLTGYRHLAAEVVDQALAKHFPENKTRSNTQHLKLTAGNFPNHTAVNSFLQNCQLAGLNQGFAAEQITWLVRNYGLHAAEILEYANSENPEIPPENRLLKANIWYAITAEGATNLSDFLIRRTGKLYFEREKIPAILPAVTTFFQEILNWTEIETRKNLEDFLFHYHAAVNFPEDETSKKNGRILT